MKDREPLDPIENEILKNIDAIGTPSPGHTDSNGELIPKYTGDEIRNKFMTTIGFAKSVNREDLAELARQRFLEVYPDQADFLREIEKKDDDD